MRSLLLLAMASAFPAVPTMAEAPPPRLVAIGPVLAQHEAPPGTVLPGERAMTALDLAIAPDGSVRTCEVALSSGQAELDRYACALFARDAAYAPAHDGITARARREFWVWEAPKRARVAGSKAVVARAGPNADRWVTTDDLRGIALARDQVVTSNVALTISPDGRVAGCAASLPSDRPDLDRRACDLVMARARYRPALDAAGRPVAGKDWKTFRWQVPRD